MRLLDWAVAQISSLRGRVSSQEESVSFLLDVAVPQRENFYVASSTWIWNHNLGRPLTGVQVFDMSGNLFISDIQEVSINRIVAVHLYNATGYMTAR